MDITYYILMVYAGFALVELFAGRFFNSEASRKGDARTEVISTLAFVLVVVPSVFFFVNWGLAHYAPGIEGAIADWPVFAILALFLLGDDMTQYWWHRLSHHVPWLYNLHRAHHDVGYMSVRIVYRNSLVYYLFMPGLWISAALVYMGGGDVYIGYLAVKMTVIIAAHSSVRWDEKLYTTKLGALLMWPVERLISTPSTHAMHHGKHVSDGVTHYKGNYGNLLFFWDVLFGTAKISRRFPAEFGVENLDPLPWYRLVFLPFARERT